MTIRDILSSNAKLLILKNKIQQKTPKLSQMDIENHISKIPYYALPAIAFVRLVNCTYQENFR